MTNLGLIDERVSQLMINNNETGIGLILNGGKVIGNINMLFDFWLIYAYQNDLIRDQYIYPDNIINWSLEDVYKKYGASKEGFLIGTYLRMLGEKIDYYEIKITPEITNMINSIRTIRAGYQIQ